MTAKLTDKDVAYIRGVLNLDRRERKTVGLNRHSNGIKQRLADKFGVSVHTIHEIQHGRRRRRVRIKDHFPTMNRDFKP